MLHVTRMSTEGNSLPDLLMACPAQKQSTFQKWTLLLLWLFTMKVSGALLNNQWVVSLRLAWIWSSLQRPLRKFQTHYLDSNPTLSLTLSRWHSPLSSPSGSALQLSICVRIKITTYVCMYIYIYSFQSCISFWPLRAICHSAFAKSHPTAHNALPKQKNPYYCNCCLFCCKCILNKCMIIRQHSRPMD